MFTYAVYGKLGLRDRYFGCITPRHDKSKSSARLRDELRQQRAWTYKSTVFSDVGVYSSPDIIATITAAVRQRRSFRAWFLNVLSTFGPCCATPHS